MTGLLPPFKSLPINERASVVFVEHGAIDLLDGAFRVEVWVGEAGVRLHSAGQPGGANGRAATATLEIGARPSCPSPCHRKAEALGAVFSTWVGMNGWDVMSR